MTIRFLPADEVRVYNGGAFSFVADRETEAAEEEEDS